MHDSRLHKIARCRDNDRHRRSVVTRLARGGEPGDDEHRWRFRDTFMDQRPHAGRVPLTDAELYLYPLARTCPACRMPSRKLSVNGRVFASVPPRIITTRGGPVAVSARAEIAATGSDDAIP